MKTLRVALACLLLLVPIAAVAQEYCPCVPISYQWIVEACDSWNCAAAATIMANGDKFMLTLPTGSDDFKWIVVRRVASGSYAASSNAPFRVETYDGVGPATTRYQSIDQQYQPLMVSAADGKFLVLMRSSEAPPQQTTTRR